MVRERKRKRGERGPRKGVGKERGEGLRSCLSARVEDGERRRRSVGCYTPHSGVHRKTKVDDDPGNITWDKEIQETRGISSDSIGGTGGKVRSRAVTRLIFPLFWLAQKKAGMDLLVPLVCLDFLGSVFFLDASTAGAGGALFLLVCADGIGHASAGAGAGANDRRVATVVFLVGFFQRRGSVDGFVEDGLWISSLELGLQLVRRLPVTVGPTSWMSHVVTIVLDLVAVAAPVDVAMTGQYVVVERKCRRLIVRGGGQ